MIVGPIIFGVEQIRGDSRQNLQSIDTYAEEGEKMEMGSLLIPSGMPINWDDGKK